jgi:hypothetical protein
MIGICFSRYALALVLGAFMVAPVRIDAFTMVEALLRVGLAYHCLGGQEGH